MASRRKLKLSTEDSEKIENMFVEVGKIGGFSRSTEKAGAWNYFGELCYRFVRFRLVGFRNDYVQPCSM